MDTPHDPSVQLDAIRFYATLEALETALHAPLECQHVQEDSRDSDEITWGATARGINAWEAEEAMDDAFPPPGRCPRQKE